MTKKNKAKTTDERIHQVIDSIQAKLALLEEYAAWTIRGNQRFKIGQRVEFSRKAKEKTISDRTKGGVTRGKVTAIDGFILKVLLDGYKRPHGYHHSFFNPVSGPKLF